MKKVGLILLLCLLAVGLVLGGCSKQEVAPVSPAPEEVVENEVSGEVTELKFAYFGPGTGSPGQAMERAAQIVEERTNGKVKITNYFSESLITDLSHP